MNRFEPPRIAGWILERCVPGDQTDVLAGDLLEEFRAGRTVRWYRHQVLSAVVAGWMREMRDHAVKTRGSTLVA
jgi:hypothetical protein